jgi:CRISPR/Cas system-associated endoribonuclease Cas2
MKKVTKISISTLLGILISSWIFLYKNDSGISKEIKIKIGDQDPLSEDGRKGNEGVAEMKILDPNKNGEIKEKEVSSVIKNLSGDSRNWEVVKEIERERLERIQESLVRVPLRHTEELEEKISSIDDGVSKVMTVSHAYTRGLRVNFAYAGQKYFLYSFSKDPNFSSGYALSKETGFAFRWDLN